MTSPPWSVDDAETLVDLLVEKIPWWTDTWTQHRVDYGAQAPPAFLRTVAALTASRAFAGDAQDWEQFRLTLEFLEAEFGSDPAMDAFIATSFLARIPDPELLGSVVSPHLGPKLRAELKRQRSGEGFSAPSTTSAFMTELATTHAAIASVLHAHLADWGELLSHIFMSDLARAAISWRQTAEGRVSVASLLTTLDDAYGHDYEVDELIATGFVENLPYPDEDGAELLAMLGPKLRAEYNLERPSHQIRDPRA